MLTFISFESLIKINQDNECKIFVKKLPSDVTEKWVHQRFVQYGTIEKINLVRDLNGCLTGTAMVVFNDLKPVVLAFKGCSSGPLEVSIPNNKQLKRTLSQSQNNIKQETIADIASDNSNMVVSKSTDASQSSRNSSHVSLKRKAGDDNLHNSKKATPLKSPQSKIEKLISASVYTPLNNREVFGGYIDAFCLLHHFFILDLSHFHFPL